MVENFRGNLLRWRIIQGGNFSKKKLSEAEKFPRRGVALRDFFLFRGRISPERICSGKNFSHVIRRLSHESNNLTTIKLIMLKM